MSNPHRAVLVCFILAALGGTLTNLACAGFRTEPTGCDDPFHSLESGTYAVHDKTAQPEFEGIIFSDSDRVDIQIDRANERVSFTYEVDSTSRTETWRIEARSTAHGRMR